MEGLYIFNNNKYMDQVTGTSILSLLAKKDNFEIMLYEIKADKPSGISPNFNKENSSTLMEFYYILEGSLVVGEGDNAITLSKNDYFYVDDIKKTVPMRTLTDTKILYVSSQPVYNLLYTYSDDLRKLLEKSEKKDVYTHKHSSRVQDYSIKIAAKLGLSGEINYTIALASLFHDVGKIFIPDDILNKPSELNENEFSYIKKHSTYSSELLKGKFLKDISKIVEQHHERLDGSGYPNGLKGDEICIEAKIIAVADSYDAMTSDRAYREAMSPKTSMEEIKRMSGKYYDEDVVQALELILKEENILI